MVSELAETGLPITVRSNEVNLGHGPTTIRALRAGLDAQAEVVVAVDGDGQFRGSDIARLVGILQTSGCDVVEGVRTSRSDPLFRRVTSVVTRGLVWLRVRKSPRDANTPLRVYRPEVLADVLATLPDDAMTPNLLISAWTRRTGVALREEFVDSLDRRGDTAHGSSWQARHQLIPSRRFVTFCLKAGLQWVRPGQTR